MRIRRMLLGFLLSLLALGGTAAIAQPASAAGTICYGDYCSGQDPQATHCADGAYTVSYAQVYFRYKWQAAPRSASYAGLLELRWSPACQTNWARFTPQNGFSYTVKAVQRETGYTQQRNAGSWQSAWTSQIYSSDVRLRYRADPVVAGCDAERNSHGLHLVAFCFSPQP